MNRAFVAQRVVTLAAINMISTGCTNEKVIPLATFERVITNRAVKCVITSKALKNILRSPTKKEICSRSSSLTN